MNRPPQKKHPPPAAAVAVMPGEYRLDLVLEKGGAASQYACMANAYKFLLRSAEPGGSLDFSGEISSVSPTSVAISYTFKTRSRTSPPTDYP